MSTTTQPQLFPALRDQNRQHNTRGRETFMVDFNKIICLPEKNKRLPQNYGNIEELAESLFHNGMVQPLMVDAYLDHLENYVVYLNDGWRRYNAIKLLHEQGRADGFATVECFINPKETTNEDRILKMFTTQDNKQLEPIEQAACFKELRDLHGYNSISIAAKVGKSRIYVDQFLKLADDSEEVKDAVATGKISATGAIELQKSVKSPERRAEIVKEAIEKGETKVSHFKKKAEFAQKFYQAKGGYKVLAEYGYENFVGECIEHELDFIEIKTGDEINWSEGMLIDEKDAQVLRDNKVPFVYIHECTPAYKKGQSLFSKVLKSQVVITDVLKSERNKPYRYVVESNGVQVPAIQEEDSFKMNAETFEGKPASPNFRELIQEYAKGDLVTFGAGDKVALVTKLNGIDPLFNEYAYTIYDKEFGEKTKLQSELSPASVRVYPTTATIEIPTETDIKFVAIGVLQSGKVKYFAAEKSFSEVSKKLASFSADKDIENTHYLQLGQLNSLIEYWTELKNKE